MLSKQHGLLQLHEVVEIEELMEADEFLGVNKHVFFAVGVDILWVELEDGIGSDFFLEGDESLIVFLASVDHVAHFEFVEGAFVLFFLQHFKSEVLKMMS